MKKLVNQIEIRKDIYTTKSRKNNQDYNKQFMILTIKHELGGITTFNIKQCLFTY